MTTDGTGNVNFVATFPNSVPQGYFITATATDPNNNTSEFSQCIEIIAPINLPPDCGGATIADQSADMNCQAVVSGTDVTGVTDPDGDPLTITVSPTNLALGANTVTVTADDGKGGTCNTTITVNVIDDTDPTLTVSSTPITLWPPNHKYSSIDISQYITAVSDNCTSLSASNVVITRVSSDEEEDAKGGGDGNSKDDIVISSCSTVDLRAECQGGSNGRVYTINLEVRDGNGNTANASIQVQVPKSQNGNPAVDDGDVYSISSGCNSAAPKMSGNFGRTETQAAIPEGFALEQNYPNPFNPSTQIRFAIPEASAVTLQIFNSAGQLVRTLVAAEMAPGFHSLTWNALDDSGLHVASGLYLYMLKAGGFVAQRKLILMK